MDIRQAKATLNMPVDSALSVAIRARGLNSSEFFMPPPTKNRSCASGEITSAAAATLVHCQCRACMAGGTTLLCMTDVTSSPTRMGRFGRRTDKWPHCTTSIDNRACKLLRLVQEMQINSGACWAGSTITNENLNEQVSILLGDLPGRRVNACANL